MDVTDQIIKQASERIAQDIDWQILSSLLEEAGWTRIKIEHDPPIYMMNELYHWIDKHRTGSVHRYMDEFLFQNEKDVTMFLLRWSS